MMVEHDRAVPMIEQIDQIMDALIDHDSTRIWTLIHCCWNGNTRQSTFSASKVLFLLWFPFLHHFFGLVLTFTSFKGMLVGVSHHEFMCMMVSLSLPPSFSCLSLFLVKLILFRRKSLQDVIYFIAAVLEMPVSCFMYDGNGCILSLHLF